MNPRHRQPEPRRRTWLVAPLLTLGLSAAVPAADVTPRVPSDVAQVINTYCVSCHGAEKQKGKVRLDQMGALSGEAFTKLLHKAHEALEFQGMPPEDAKQPTAAQRKLLTDWVQAQVDALGHGEDADKLRYPHYGNYVDHDRLFDGSVKDKAYTPARRWLVSPMIFKQRVMDAMQVDPKDRSYYETRNFHGVTNPFVLPDHSGVRDYDITRLDGGHLLVMLGNAQWIAGKQIFATRVHGQNARNLTFENPQDKWYPRPFGPDAFKALLKKETSPTDAELLAAVRTQFNLVLGRDPSEQEAAAYLKLTRDATDLGGNEQGLRQMLVAVLLESEFLYRLEFGAGEADAHGRRVLSPREAAYAISYAIGDRAPDAKLMEAAQQGRLKTKDDFRREVLRLLDEPNHYRGQVDPVVSGGHMQSITVSHPRIVRFFREFFGYPAALKVFKDVNRSDGFYDNPGRGSAQTPGWIINEADMFVQHCVEKDRDVFSTLLTSDAYFVAPTENAQAKVDNLNLIYAHFKDTNWRKDPEGVIKANEEFVKKNMPYRAGAKQLTQMMTHVELFLKQGLQPHPQWGYPFGVHKLTPWTKAYNIDAAVSQYAVDQPFKLAHRKGILTHPAWLIAHSQNTATDPVRRGKWVREKLLAGHVPDVPITVDARIPEDPHKTLRDRLDAVTARQECWRCHQHMNPLGLPFEIYDDFGRYRTAESLEYPENLIARTKSKYGADTYKTLPVNPAGHLKGTGDSALDGDVTDALDMIDRLAKSQRVRQSIIRHAFRFYMGRNEMLSDSQTLIDADRAYVQSGGSFKAVIVSLLTSDSFMYRK